MRVLEGDACVGTRGRRTRSCNGLQGAVGQDGTRSLLCEVEGSAREPKLGNRRILRLAVHEESDGAGAIIIRRLSRSMEAWCVARGAWCWVVGFAAPVKTNSGLGHGWDKSFGGVPKTVHTF